MKNLMNAKLVLGMTMIMSSVCAPAHADLSFKTVEVIAGIEAAKILGRTGPQDIRAHISSIDMLLSTTEAMFHNVNYLEKLFVVRPNSENLTVSASRPVMRADAIYVAHPPMVIRKATSDEGDALKDQESKWVPVLVKQNQQAKDTVNHIFAQLPKTQKFEDLQKGMLSNLQEVDAALAHGQYPKAYQIIHEAHVMNGDVARYAI
jgi:hypothetical protein